MHNSYDRLAQLLCEVPEYAVEGRLNKNIVAELARKYDTGLINKLLSDKDTKKLFFSDSDAGPVFKKTFSYNSYHKKNSYRIPIPLMSKKLV